MIKEKKVSLNFRYNDQPSVFRIDRDQIGWRKLLCFLKVGNSRSLHTDRRRIQT